MTKPNCRSAEMEIGVEGPNLADQHSHQNYYKLII